MNKTYNKGAIGLLVVMGVGFLALTGVLVMSEGVLSGLITEQNTTATIRAFYASESVMQEGVGRHLEEVSKSNASSSAYTLTSNLSFTNGATAKEITVTPEPGTYRFTVKGEAESNKALRKIVKTLTSYPAGEAFDYALYSAGVGTTISGNLDISGNIYSEGDLKVSDAAVKIDGSLSSHSGNFNIHPNSTLTKETNENHYQVPPPTISYDKYKEKASSTGSYFTSAVEAVNCIKNGSCDNKVVYIDADSDVIIKEDEDEDAIDFTGSIISVSNLKIKGTFRAFNEEIDGAIYNYPAIVTKGNLDLLPSTIYGVVIVEGSVGVTANNSQIIGSVILTSTEDTAKFSGTITMTFDSQYSTSITNFIGLGFESDNIDSIMLLNWHEE